MARINTVLVQNLLIENLRTMDFSAPFGTFDSTQRRYKFDHLGEFLKEADKLTSSKLLEEYNKKEWFREIAQIGSTYTNTAVIPHSWFIMDVVKFDTEARGVYLEPKEFLLLNRNLINSKVNKGYWTIDNGLVRYVDGSGNMFRIMYIDYNQYPLSPAGFEHFVVDYATYLGLRVRNDNPVEAEHYLNSFVNRFASLRVEPVFKGR